jgi:cobalt-zinc-cadmium resistance protein CzcA
MPIQTAVGGNALTQVLIGEQRYDLVLRYSPVPQYAGGHRENSLLAPSGERVSLAQLDERPHVFDGGSEIYREENSRYVA